MWLLLVLACWDDAPRAADHCTLAKTVKVRTEDGATVALHHHPASGPPVLMVHGISSNHHFFDLDAEHSMADWLADRGHDVWLLDLRGHGDAATHKDGRPQLSGWRVDDYGRYDVHAAVDHVRACTGYDTVGYVGHSMGGMVGAIYVATHGDDALSSLTFLGSPGTFTKNVPLTKLAGSAFAAGGAATVFFDTAILAATAADFSEGPLRVRLQERLYNPENFEPATIARMLRTIVSPLSRGEMAHFARMIRAERFQSWDGTIGYLDALAEVDVPAFLVVGTGDRVVAPAWVEAYGPAFGGPVEVFRAGTESGLVADYGHLDLALGERAGTEIFPRVEAWLDRHPPREGKARLAQGR
ncbi:MAG: alpha/beta hydrolase [Myxococcota bacterium]